MEKWVGNQHTNPNNWHNLVQGNLELATFGAGCFWGTEKFFARDFEKNFPGSILGTAVGYMHPDASKLQAPTYDEICEGDTGFIEVAHVLFDNSKANFEEVTKFFFTFHDPSTYERQGNDAGSQYTSIIFYHDPDQKNISEKVKDEVQQLIN